jgi:hypothetical protein
LVTDRNPAAGGILWSTDLSNPLHGRMNGLIADWRGAADPTLGDNRSHGEGRVKSEV